MLKLIVTVIALASLGCSSCGPTPSFEGCDFPVDDGLDVMDVFYDGFVERFGDDDGLVLDAFRNLRVQCLAEKPACGEGTCFGVTLSPTRIEMVNAGRGARGSTLSHELMHAALWAKTGGVEASHHPWPDDVSAYVFELYGHE